jgi:hypothetical protein
MTITDNLRDAAYIVIGMGVIGAQRAQVRREELTKQFNEAIRQADARLAPVVDAVEAQFDTVVDRLPAPAKELIGPARQVGKDVRAQVRSRVVSTERP